MKNRLVKSGIDVKSMCSHLDVTTAHAVTEDTGVFKIFQKDIENVKFPLERSEVFRPDNDTFCNVKKKIAN